MGFHRVVACALVSAVFIAGVSSAAGPVSDPDAKGTISITTSGVGMDGTSITASGSLTTVTGWSTGTVTLYASLNIGGRIRIQDATVTGGTWSASIKNVPNGTYTIWAFQTLQQSGQPDQLVGSALGSVTVNTTGNPNVEVHGGVIGFGQGQPARTNGGAGISGSGLYASLPGYQIDGNNPVELVTIPKDGGSCAKNNRGYRGDCGRLEQCECLCAQLSDVQRRRYDGSTASITESTGAPGRGPCGSQSMGD